jgi:hypothetical protein
MSLQVGDERTDSAVVLVSETLALRFGAALPLPEQECLAAAVNTHLEALGHAVAVENDLFPSTHAHIDDDDAILF